MHMLCNIDTRSAADAIAETSGEVVSVDCSLVKEVEGYISKAWPRFNLTKKTTSQFRKGTKASTSCFQQSMLSPW